MHCQKYYKGLQNTVHLFFGMIAHELLKNSQISLPKTIDINDANIYIYECLKTNITR